MKKKISELTSSKYSTVTSSATSSLHIACLALSVSQNDTVWTTSNTFVSSINCALYCGAKIDLVDIDLETYNIDIKKLEKKLAKTKKINLPKVLIIVHFAGNPCDMKKIYKLSKKYNFKIIEDASHALGAKYGKHKIGDCKYSDITVFSFHPVKIITTGEGGVATCNNNSIYLKLQSLRSHGIINSNKKYLKEKKLKPWMFYQEYLGYNYRLTDISAALGLSQLKKLNFFLSQRNKIAKIYNHKLKNLPLILPKIDKNNLSSFHLYVILFKDDKNKNIRDKIYIKLLKSGIKTNIHYIPIYNHPYFKKFNFNKKDFINNEYYFKRAISLPIYPGLKLKQINFIVSSLKKFLNEI